MSLYVESSWCPPKSLSTKVPWYRSLLGQVRTYLPAHAQDLTSDVAQVHDARRRSQSLSESDRLERFRHVCNEFAAQVYPIDVIKPSAEWRSLRNTLLGYLVVYAKHTVGLMPHDTQIFAAIEMTEGRLTQLAPGEGKTLSIALAAAVYGVCGKPVHVVTANDYLAERDVTLMRVFYRAVGLTADCVLPELKGPDLKSAYQACVVYGTGKQFLADFLRDQLVVGGDLNASERRIWSMRFPNKSADVVGRGLWVAIIDEADNVLIDEASTPLIISSADDNPLLIEAVLGSKKILENLKRDVDYVVTLEPVTDVRFTDAGKTKVNELAYLLPEFWRLSSRATGMVSLSIMAKYVYTRNRHYIINEENKVVIVDEKTGRTMPGRTWSHGIHQAIEAFEGLELSDPPRTVARMTFQNFYNRYHRICGASGTLQGTALELIATYRVIVSRLAPRIPSRLVTETPAVFKRDMDRFVALVDEIVRIHQTGQPVLVGTRKISDTERISDALATRGVVHQVLNAKHLADEAEIVALAGQLGSVTISTNMAGRGTDIALGVGTSELGGLRVLVYEPHESARIEWQLYGRSGRQGAPGSAKAYICLYDELLVNALGPLYVKTLPVMTEFWMRPFLAVGLVRLAQWLVQFKAYRSRQALAKRDQLVSKQLSFSE